MITDQLFKHGGHCSIQFVTEDVTYSWRPGADDPRVEGLQGRRRYSSLLSRPEHHMEATGRH